jgi:hypothetical protein
MSAIVGVGRASLAACAEVGIVTDSALVSITLNICLRTIAAERTITIDAVVACLAAVRSRQSNDVVERLIDGDKSVARMDETGVDNANWAEVPIWAVEALVTNSIYVLVTSITDSVVARVATRSKQSLGNRLKNGIFNSWSETMFGVVAMLVVNVARNAQIIIVTSSASNEALLGKF